MNFQCTTAAFTLSPAPDGFRHLVLTHPGTEPSMRFLFVGSHLCTRASSRQTLAELPLPSASSYFFFRPQGGHYRYSYRGLAPHQFMPMPGVHKALVRTQTTLRFVCAAQLGRCRLRVLTPAVCFSGRSMIGRCRVFHYNALRGFHSFIDVWFDSRRWHSRFLTLNSSGERYGT